MAFIESPSTSSLELKEEAKIKSASKIATTIAKPCDLLLGIEDETPPTDHKILALDVWPLFIYFEYEGIKFHIMMLVTPFV